MRFKLSLRENFIPHRHHIILLSKSQPIVEIFSDMPMRGVHSIYGAYLSLAGATATVIGFVTGFGEFIGYSFRLVTGFIVSPAP